jgi:glutathione S-transferase
MQPAALHLGPQSALEMVCGYCVKLLLVVNEAGVPFTYYMADISTPDDKPEWLSRVNPKKECPAARLPGETENWVAGSDQIPAALAAVNPRMAEVVARSRPPGDGTGVSAEDAARLKSWTFIWIAAVITPAEMTVDEAFAKGGMIVFMMKAIGATREEGGDERKVREVAAVRRCKLNPVDPQLKSDCFNPITYCLTVSIE